MLEADALIKCSVCGVHKVAGIGFYKMAASPTGFRATCKDCEYERTVQLRVINGKDKVCAKCGVQQSITEFHTCSAARDKLQSWCKTCMAEAKRQPVNKVYASMPKAAKKVKKVKVKTTTSVDDIVITIRFPRSCVEGL